jgi:hypothetical protein
LDISSNLNCSLEQSQSIILDTIRIKSPSASETKATAAKALITKAPKINMGGLIL